MQITPEFFKSVFPTAIEADEWVDALNVTLPTFDIDTLDRVAGFLSQCGAETGGWRWFEENMNYSADRMMQVWPRIFNRELANKCHYKPVLVASYAYGNRMGNGPAETEDGWKFRGRGPIHLTGRNNYLHFARDVYPGNEDFIMEDPDVLVTDKSVSIATATWYWTINNINVYADARDVRRMTKAVNGGYNGLDHRQAYYDKIMNYFA